MSARTLRLGQIIDPAAVTVLTRTAPDGTVAEAWLDLAALPRVEGLVRGRPVAEVPRLVERLCGLCPVAHHLAGIAALEALWGLGAPPAAAARLRRTLHLGDLLRTHARSLTTLEPVAAADLQRLGTAAVLSAGGPGHFPACAAPGGVLRRPDAGELASLAELARSAPESARRLLQATAGRAAGVPAGVTAGVTAGTAAGGRRSGYEGHDVALVDEHGLLDPCGARLTAVTPDGTRTITAARPEEWRALVAETDPGSSASRPYLRPLGPEAGAYRVGPVAQLRAAALSTPAAEEARGHWLAAAGGAAWARAVLVMHLAEALAELTTRLLADASTDALAVEPTGAGPMGTGAVGTGWIDGARGLLVHSYRGDPAGALEEASILTPTAQNEPWLAALLREALRDTSDPEARASALEHAVREADPCLPCTLLPPGQLTVTVLEAPRAAGGAS